MARFDFFMRRNIFNLVMCNQTNFLFQMITLEVKGNNHMVWESTRYSSEKIDFLCVGLVLDDLNPIIIMVNQLGFVIITQNIGWVGQSVGANFLVQYNWPSGESAITLFPAVSSPARQSYLWRDFFRNLAPAVLAIISLPPQLFDNLKMPLAIIFFSPSLSHPSTAINAPPLPSQQPSTDKRRE